MMWVTCVCVNCGEVPCDRIKRWATLSVDGKTFIETIHVKCEICGREEGKDYRYSRQQYKRIVGR